ncbi:MAG: hypothetical protein K5641_05590 [Lachnospiraceae bacterium]|nr:hypothetical protein [Lachnospiraceae bacterium]
MKWKKSVFTGLWWIISYILSCVTLAAIGVPFIKNAGLEQPEFRILLLCLLFAAEIVLFFLLHSLVLYFRPTDAEHHEDRPGRGYALIFGASVLFIIGMALAVRIGYISTTGSTLTGDLSLYEHAKISAGGIPLLAHNGETFYVALLSVILSFSGNNPETVIYFQTVLQCLSICFVFAFVKMSIGRTAAVFAAFAAAFAPTLITELNTVSPGTLLTTAILCVLCIAAGVLRYTAKEEKCGIICVLHFLFLGLFSGGLFYLDLSGIIVSVIIFLAFLCLKYRCHIFGKILQGFVYLIGLASAVALLILMESELTGHPYVSVRGAFIHNQEFSVRFTIPPVPSLEQSIAICVLLVFISFGMFGFFKQSYDKGLIVIMLCVVTAVGIALHAFSIKLDMLGIAALIMTASCGVQYFADLWVGEADEVPVVVEKKEEAFAGYASLEPTLVIPSDAPTQEQNGEKKVKFIPNPLPVPKKHVKRELDFGKEVADEDMRYDIEVSADDDFDIK